MVVVLANDIPPAVRGRMKLWFVEPRANVFVSGIKDSVADDVVDYLLKFCPIESGMLIFKKIRNAPGYRVYRDGATNRKTVEFSGLQLVLEKEPELGEKPKLA